MSRKGGVKKMDMHLIQVLQNKVLCGIELSDSEKKYLEKYKQSENDVFAKWLDNNY